MFQQMISQFMESVLDQMQPNQHTQFLRRAVGIIQSKAFLSI